MVRKMLKAHKPALGTLLLLGLWLATSSGNPQKQQERSNELAVKLSTDLITLNAHVLSKKTNKAITGLSKGNFELYEESVRQEVTHFSYDQFPLSVILLIDSSGSVGSIQETLDKIHRAGLEAVRYLKPDDEVAIMGFSSAVGLVQDFTTNKQVALDKFLVGKFHPDSGWDSIDFSLDGTRIADAIYQAAIHFRRAANPIGRRAIIVVTDNMATSASYSEREVTEQLFESDAVVYGLVIGRRHLFDKTISAVSLKKNGGNANTYADKTGGVVLNGRGNKATEKLIEIISLLRQQYSFGYVSTNPQMDGKFRKIKVRVTPEVEKREGGVTILTRQGYYARRRDSAVKPAQEKPPAPKND